MNDIIPFFNFDEHRIRYVVVGKKVWFVAKDIAVALGYVNPAAAIKKHCKHAHKLENITENHGVRNGHHTQGCEDMHPHTLMIDRGDLNRLVAKSHLPAAQRFEELVFDKILVEIQDKGYYIAPGADAMIGSRPEATPEWLEAAADAMKLLANRYRHTESIAIDMQARNIELEGALASSEKRAKMLEECAQAERALREKARKNFKLSLDIGYAKLKDFDEAETRTAARLTGRDDSLDLGSGSVVPIKRK